MSATAHVIHLHGDQRPAIDRLADLDFQVRGDVRRLRVRVRPLGLEPSWALAMVRLSKLGVASVTVREFREWALLETNGHYPVERMLALGFLASEPNPLNLNSRLLSLTDKGRELVGRLRVEGL